MIVGDGMIAKAMKNIDNDSFIFFCSGVSKSNEIDTLEFQKEAQLLKKLYDTDKCLIYFSSYFVNFDSYSTQPYYKHKIEMENIIQKEFNSFKIFRLPQIVGDSKNKSTLTNFINHSIRNNLCINIYTNAVRNLVDIDDVVKIVDYANKNNLFLNSKVNLVGTKNYNIIDIVNCMEDILDTKAIKKFENSTEKEFGIIICDEMLDVYKALDINFDETYLNKTLMKYYKNGVK